MSFDEVVQDTAEALTSGVPLRLIVDWLLKLGAGAQSAEIVELEALYRLEDKRRP